MERETITLGAGAYLLTLEALGNAWACGTSAIGLRALSSWLDAARKYGNAV